MIAVDKAAMVLACGVVLTSCATVDLSISTPKFKKTYADAEYCELKMVKQKNQSACGLACLESLLDYWDLDGTQDELGNTHPPAESLGYSLAELKSIAEKRELSAFSVSFEEDPLPLLHRQLEQGRPTLLAIRCPLGRYFGDPVPLIEHVDSSVVGVSVREERLAGAPIASTRGRTKNHYVVAFGFDKAAKEILLMDPAYGLVSLGEGRLLGFWGEQSYAALVCAPAGESVSHSVAPYTGE